MCSLTTERVLLHTQYPRSNSAQTASVEQAPIILVFCRTLSPLPMEVKHMAPTGNDTSQPSALL